MYKSTNQSPPISDECFRSESRLTRLCVHFVATDHGLKPEIEIQNFQKT